MKRVLMERWGNIGRHSAGSMVALQAYLEAPEKVAAIILIAPAVTAPLVMEEVKTATTSPDPGIRLLLWNGSIPNTEV